MSRRRTPEEAAWIVAAQPTMTVADCRSQFTEQFGWCPSPAAWSVWNQHHGVVPRRVGRPNNKRVERRVRWSEEPEMDSWMDENDKGQSSALLSDMFRARFGFGLTQTQITMWRQAHGRQTKRQLGNGENKLKPTGTVSKSKNGYLKYKLKERPDVPGSKDNWHFIQRDIYTVWYGEIPDGCDVMFADGDMRNFDPYNLVAVPRRFQAQLKQLDYTDRDSLIAAMVWCEVQSEKHRLTFLDRKCVGCGRTFTPESKGRTTPAKYCPDCVAAGKHRDPANRKPKGKKICASCGAEFIAYAKNQRRCRACIGANPKGAAR
jgi:hypothetical protein